MQPLIAARQHIDKGFLHMSHDGYWILIDYRVSNLCYASTSIPKAAPAIQRYTMSDSGSEFSSNARHKASFRSKVKGLFKTEKKSSIPKKRDHSSEGRLLAPTSQSEIVARSHQDNHHKTLHSEDTLTEPLTLGSRSNPNTASSGSQQNVEPTPPVSDDTSIQELQGIAAQTRALATRKQLCPIHELWNQAYDELKEKEEKLMQNYEKCLGGDISTIASLTLSTMELKKRRQEEMANLLQKKVDEARRNAWKLKFGGKDIPVKDLAEPVVGIIKYVPCSIPHSSAVWSCTRFATIVN